MKLYKTKTCLLIEEENNFFSVEENWDSFVNDNLLFEKMEEIVRRNDPLLNGQELIDKSIEAPIGSQELWASGVTYLRSKMGRQEESEKSGSADFYQHVYEAERPELFFKANANRVVGHRGKVRIRGDSSWDVPEPELTLFVTSGEKIVGYTIGNDMSSRSIEGENPLYLPQAKTYDGCAAIGPCMLVRKDPLPRQSLIDMEIRRKGMPVFSGNVKVSQIKRRFEELVSFLYRECTFSQGCLLMTGTGIVPGREFTLQQGDEITITIDPIGTLINEVDL